MFKQRERKSLKNRDGVFPYKHFGVLLAIAKEIYGLKSCNKAI